MFIIRAGPLTAGCCTFLLALLLANTSAAQGQSPTAKSAPPVAAPRPGLILEVPFHTTNNWIILDGQFGKDLESAQKAPVVHLILDTGASVSDVSQEWVESRKLSLETAIETPKEIRVKGSGDSNTKTMTRRVCATLLLSNDTGKSFEVDYVPNVKRQKLKDSLAAGISGSMYGLGGVTNRSKGRLDILQFGPHHWSAPPTFFL